MRFDCSKFRRVLASVLFLAAAGSCGSALAAGDPVSCQLPEMKTGERPDAGGGATKVAVGIVLADLTEIDDVKQQFTVDFLMHETWRDPRLKGLKGCRFDLQQVWSPKLDFRNSGRVFPGFPPRVTVGPEGTAHYVQRYRGSLSFPHRLDEFPFDQHLIGIAVIPVGGSLQEVELTVDEKNTSRLEELTIPDWTLGDASGRITTFEHPQTGLGMAQYHFEIPAQRRHEYYLWKVLVPLMLIVAMSWSVFWINPAQFGPQIGMSATSMLTLIAFQFAMAGILPRLHYFTQLDGFITASTGLVFLALVEALTTSYLVSVDRKELALRLDRICRWAFPLAFVGMVVLIFGI